jgi:uncharacterized protein (UPF0548 family)
VEYTGGDGEVYFHVMSFSKGAFPLGSLLLPIIRPLQVSAQGGGLYGRAHC